jgi:hypothetical protein
MKHDEFAKQIDRLIVQFGKQSYSEERAALIWKEMFHIDAHEMEKVVDKFIGEFRHAPLLTDFRDELAKNREQKREKDKEREAQPWSALPDDEIRMVMQTITKRSLGQVPDDEWRGFMSTLDEWAKTRRA